MAGRGSITRSGSLKGDGKNEKGEKSQEKKSQQKIDEKYVKKVTFDETAAGGSGSKKEDNAKALDDFKLRVMEEVRKLRQEKVGIEKLKIEVDSKIVELSERLESLEKLFKEFEEREREREEARSVWTESSLQSAGKD